MPIPGEIDFLESSLRCNGAIQVSASLPLPSSARHGASSPFRDHPRSDPLKPVDVRAAAENALRGPPGDRRPISRDQLMWDRGN
jgi:hypothetical protein